MKHIGEAIASILSCLLILALLFVFDGEPDLWDKWHAMAMGTECKQR